MPVKVIEELGSWSPCPIVQSVQRLGGYEAVKLFGHHRGEEDGCYWYAEVGEDHEIRYYRLHTIKETKCGAWVQADFDPAPYWRSFGRLAKTRRDALQALHHRKRAYVEHSKRRLRQAIAQLEVTKVAIGVDDKLDTLRLHRALALLE